MAENTTRVAGTPYEYHIEDLVNVTIDELIDRGYRFTIIQPKEEESLGDDFEY